MYNYTIKILQLQQSEKGRNSLDFWYFNWKIIPNDIVHFVGVFLYTSQIKNLKPFRFLKTFAIRRVNSTSTITVNCMYIAQTIRKTRYSLLGYAKYLYKQQQ